MVCTVQKIKGLGLFCLHHQKKALKSSKLLPPPPVIFSKSRQSSPSPLLFCLKAPLENVDTPNVIDFNLNFQSLIKMIRSYFDITLI